VRRWLLVLAVLLVACRDVPLPQLPGPTATPARPRQNPTDTIAIGLANEPATLAAPPQDGELARWVGQLLFSQLVGLDDKAQPRADLAESVPTLENGGARWIGDGDAKQLQTTFKLRAGAKWSDGQAVTAKDVVFTWQLALNGAFGNAIATERRYERVEAPDDATVVFTFFSERSARAAATREPARYGFLHDQRGPVVDPLYPLGLPGWWIYPAHALGPLVDNAPRSSPKAADALAKGDFARKPIGSGPFRVEDGLRFGARSDYLGGAAKTKTLVLRTADAGALQRGEVDALVGAAADGVTEGAGVRVERAADSAWERLDLNLANEALADPAVRQAVLAALDRPGLAVSAGGFPLRGLPATEGAAPASGAPSKPGATPAATPSAQPVPPPDRAEPAQAGQLLDKAGWALGADGVRQKGGKRLQLRLVTTDAPLRTRLAGTIAQQLAQIGVETRVEARPAAELFDRSNGRLAKHDFDLALYASVGGLDPAADLAAWFGSAPGGQNATSWTNGDVDRLAAEAEGTVDAAQRLTLLRQVAENVARDLPAVPLFTYARAVAFDARLDGLHAAPGTVGESWNATLWVLRS